MASSCIVCCVFHIISIPFNCSDTALRVTDAKIGPKVKIFVFRCVCFVSQIWRQNSYPGSLTFSHLGNRAKISHMRRPFSQDFCWSIPIIITNKCLKCSFKGERRGSVDDVGV